MPSKYKIIMEMASQTARDVTSNVERYTDFLVTAANNYKYSFKEQLLIHAQKPEATACAEIETWNRLGRWVNKGTKGIALLVDRDIPYKLRHVFDISDTNSRAGITITLWQMRPQYEEAVSESLQDSFGEIDGAIDFPHLLIEISKNAVDDNLSDYLSDLNAVKGDSFLEDLDDTSLEVWLKDTLKSSVAFMALSRTGYDPHEYFSREDFEHIFDFNTNAVISVLGSATSDISEMVIKESVRLSRNLKKKRNRKFAHLRMDGHLSIIIAETIILKGAMNMELTYTMQGDYRIPDLEAPESPKVGKYGMLRRTFLREHKDGIYTGMMLDGTLNSHLEEVDAQANRMMDKLTEQLKVLNGVTEQMKAEDQMKWVGLMNSIRHSAEEVVLRDLIYA